MHISDGGCMVRRCSKNRRVHRLVRVPKTKPAVKQEDTRGEKHTSSQGFESAKFAINLMFLANGGGATTIIVNMDIDKFFTPLILFSCGILESMVLAFLLIFKTPDQMHRKPIYLYIIKILIMAITFIVPCLLFLSGLMFTHFIIVHGFSPTIGKVIEYYLQYN